MRAQQEHNKSNKYIMIKDKIKQKEIKSSRLNIQTDQDITVIVDHSLPYQYRYINITLCTILICYYILLIYSIFYML